MKIKETLLPSLRKCKTREELTHFFRYNNIDDYDRKRAYLQAATNEIAAYYSGEVSMEIEKLYLDDEVLFLKGTWRLFQNNEA